MEERVGILGIAPETSTHSEAAALAQRKEERMSKFIVYRAAAK
mgnify:CR=1